MHSIRVLCVVSATVCATLTSCGKLPVPLDSTWHQKFGWNAKDYFDDQKVVALCEAIEADNLKEIDRLIADGANVNAIGKGNMTPLLWAYPESKLQRFKRLLEFGANPNVVIADDFNTHGGIEAGDSITHLACKTSFPGYFEAVFENGGDSNLRIKKLGYDETPIFTLIKGSSPNKIADLRMLIKKGADLDVLSGAGFTPSMTAVGFGGQYELALELLKAGANPNVYRRLDNSKLIHLVVAKQESRDTVWTQQKRADFETLVKWLADHGQSLDEAKADRERWRSWSATTGEYGRKMAAEVADREAKEALERAIEKN